MHSGVACRPTTTTLASEQAAESDSSGRLGVNFGLERPKLRLMGAQQPTNGCVERNQGGALFVFGADVPKLLRPTFGAGFEPPEGQTLGAANVGAPAVDAACALAIKKGAGALGMRLLVLQQVRVVGPNGVRLHRKNS